MANKKKRDEDWVEAKRRCQLNQGDIRMAKELGMIGVSIAGSFGTDPKRC